jgi:hypothetical protein
MSITNNKLKSNLRERLLAEQEKAKQKKTSKSDPRYLNYYDMEEGQTMEVLLVPDGADSGELFMSYTNHKPGKRAGIGTMVCSYVSSGESCPACLRGWEAKQAGDEEENKKWGKSNHFVGQVIPLKLPDGFVLNESPDGNIVKLFNIPFKVKELIEESIINETISDPTEHVLVIKKTLNQGKRPAYDKSYFKTKTYSESDIPDNVLEAIEEGRMVPYSLADEIPAPTTTAQVQEWFDKVMATPEYGTTQNAEPSQAQQPVRTGKAHASQADSEAIGTAEAPVAATTGGTLRDRLKARRAAQEG